jgi:ssRNA-specific RNase YbeY (16S rRNA maturation enzyme)
MLEIHNFTQNKIEEKFFQKIAEIVLKVAGVKGETEISLAIVGDGRIRKLNKMYRGKNRVTDVLAFGDKSVIPYLAKAFPRLKKGEDIEFLKRQTELGVWARSLFATPEPRSKPSE